MTKAVNFLLPILLTSLSSIAKAETYTQIEQANYLGDGLLEVSFSHNLSCEPIEFDLEVSKACTRSIPARCNAELIAKEVTNACDYRIEQKEVFQLDKEVVTLAPILLLRSEDNHIFPVEISLNSDTTEPLIEQEAIIERVSLSRAEQELKIHVWAIKGANPCQADDSLISVNTKIEESVLYISATRKVQASAMNKICTLEYKPVFSMETIKIDINKFDSIALENLQEYGNQILVDMESL